MALGQRSWGRGGSMGSTLTGAVVVVTSPPTRRADDDDFPQNTHGRGTMLVFLYVVSRQSSPLPELSVRPIENRGPGGSGLQVELEVIFLL